MSDDPYVYPFSSVLRNLRGITEPAKLEAFERRSTYSQLVRLLERPVTGAFDSAHFRAIHRHIFHNVYDWAGQFRTTPLFKQEYVGGPAHEFAPPSEIAARLHATLSLIEEADFLSGRAFPEFAREAADFFSVINDIHPFRDGNGRTQREFFRQLAQKSGYTLDFSVISQERMIEASIQAHRSNQSMMQRLFEEALDLKRHPPLKEAIQFLKEQGPALDIKWNRLYLTSAVPGESYSGKLVGIAGRNFMMLDDRKWIVVGNRSELPPSLQSGDLFTYEPQSTLQ